MDHNEGIPSARLEPDPTAEAFGPDGRLIVRVLSSLVLGGALIGLSIQWWYLSTYRPQPIRWTNDEILFQVDINESSWIEWHQLEGIGEKMAHRIVADRTEHGPFRSIEELTRVNGIGPATLDRIRPLLKMKHDAVFPASPRPTGIDGTTTSQ